jgi:hypothetical protein
MRRNTLFSALSLLHLFSPALSTPTPETTQTETTSHAQNANHIFNAIHSSMRQWGSSLNHNGMSFFLATVPAGTQLYHGRSDKEPVKGMEWLAFEPEHALIFARPRGGRGPPGGRPPPDEGSGKGPQEWNEERHDESGERGRKHHGEHNDGEGRPPHPPHQGEPSLDGHHRGHPPKGNHDESPFEHGPRPPHHGAPFDKPHHGPPPTDDDDDTVPPPPRHPHRLPPHHEGSAPEHSREHPHHGPRPDCEDDEPASVHRGSQHPFVTRHVAEPAKPGFLHTYVPKHDLKLLYIDGMSAGKTSNGTLDTQDILLLNMTSHGPMGGEYDRAQGLCNLSSTLWGNKIDGVLRMEGGFEIILCEFEEHLERVDVVAVVGRQGGNGLDSWGYRKAITKRYHGIGGGRVVLDYSNFVTLFEYPGLDLWTNDVVSDTAMPRLQNADEKDLQTVRDAVAAMILSNTTSTSTTNWQAITDQLLNRYSAPLHHLFVNTPLRSSKESYANYLSTLLSPFIDHTSRNSTLEIARCIGQSVYPLPIPPSLPPSLAHTSIHAVAHHLCTTLLSASDIAMLSLSRSLAKTSPPPSGAVELVDSLKEYLQWTSWKQCVGCGDAEICVIPIWPMGTHEQHKNPSCQKEGEGRNGDREAGYWGHGGFGRPPPGEERPGEGRPGEGPPRQVRPHGEHGAGLKKGKGKGNGHGHGRGKGGKCSSNGKKGAWVTIKRKLRVVRGWFMGVI